MVMSENVLRDILLEVHEIECGVSDNLPDFKPSLRHCIAMKMIFTRFDRNTRKLKSALKNTSSAGETLISGYTTRRYSIKKRILITALIVILMVFLAGCVAVVIKFISEHFNGTVYENNTQLFAVNLENCPQVIEYQYAFTNVPEGFELLETVPSQSNVYTCYLNNSTRQTIVLNQTVRSHFSPRYNTENSAFEEIVINNTTGLFIDFSNDKRKNSVLIWDNGDYIIEISADLDKNSVLNLSDITKI